MARYKGEPADLVEFGSDDEVGDPCPGTLIRALPADRRHEYREAKRIFVARMCAVLNLEPCTYREYVMGLTRKRQS